MTNTQFIDYNCQLASINSKNEILLILCGGVVITGLLAYSYYLQNQKLIAQAYQTAGHVQVMYAQKEAALEDKEIAELQTLHITREFEHYKQQTNAKIQIK